VVATCPRWVEFAVLIPLVGVLQAQGTSGLSGIVSDTLGNAIPLAEVSLATEPQGTSIQLRTDDRGAYRFADLAPGAYQLTVAQRGFATSRIKFELLAGEQRALPVVTLDVSICNSVHPAYVRLLPDRTLTGAFSGTIHTDRPRFPPAVNAQVTLFCESAPCRTTKTDPQGGFRFADLPVGRYRVRTGLEGFYTDDTPSIEILPGEEKCIRSLWRGAPTATATPRAVRSISANNRRHGTQKFTSDERWRPQ
jgi:Carboxypeptidase regulatory-like domain